jgi:hypothetical protein
VSRRLVEYVFPVMRKTNLTHVAAVLLGAGLTASLNGFAQGNGSAETMLMHLKPGDFEGMRNYLQVKAFDNDVRAERHEKRIADLEKQLADMGKQLTNMKHTVAAPFTVTNESGKPVMRVESNKGGGILRMLANDGAISAAAISSSPDGGTVLVNNGAGKPTAGMASMKTGGKVIVTGPDGGTTMASMGIQNNAGLISIYMASGTQLASMSGKDNEGQFNTFSRAGYATATLMSIGSSGSGFLQLLNGDSAVLVEAGETTNHVGSVKVGPTSRGPAAVMGGMGMSAASEIVGSNKK